MITKELMQDIFDNKGATLVVYSGNKVFKSIRNVGYAVSIKGHELITDMLTDKLLEAYIDMNSEYLEANYEARVGVWFNPENKKIYLDISHVYDYILNACDEAAMNDQIAIYDFSRNVSINRFTMEVMK
jgi:hypothetical protein